MIVSACIVVINVRFAICAIRERISIHERGAIRPGRGEGRPSPRIVLRSDNGVLALSRQRRLGLGHLELGGRGGHGSSTERGGGASGVEGTIAVGGAGVGRARIARERLIGIDVRLCGLRERQGKSNGRGVVELLGGWVVGYLGEVERVGDARVGVRGSLVHYLEGPVVLVGHPVDSIRLVNTLSRELRLLVLEVGLERGGVDGPVAGDDLGDGDLGVGSGDTHVGQRLLGGRDARDCEGVSGVVVAVSVRLIDPCGLRLKREAVLARSHRRGMLAGHCVLGARGANRGVRGGVARRSGRFGFRGRRGRRRGSRRRLRSRRGRRGGI